MTTVVWCVAIMGGLGVAFGVGLALASRFFHVETDPRIEAVAGALPGVNCGACGYAGCDAYAEAVVAGAPADLCIPGGHDSAAAVARIMGVQLDDERQAVRAIVHCGGGRDRCAQRYEYDGLEDCRAAHLLQAGAKACEYGCLGYGTCAAACPFGAISMEPDGLPIINWDKCTGCGACVKVCPRNLIETVPATTKYYVACSSQDKGKSVRAICTVGCISCWLCVKMSAEGAVEKRGNLPRLTHAEGADYAKAAEKCPTKCIVEVRSPLIGARAMEEVAVERGS